MTARFFPFSSPLQLVIAHEHAAESGVPFTSCWDIRTVIELVSQKLELNLVHLVVILMP